LGGYIEGGLYYPVAARPERTKLQVKDTEDMEDYCDTIWD
jgi:hypothetical protein